MQRSHERVTLKQKERERKERKREGRERRKEKGRKTGKERSNTETMLSLVIQNWNVAAHRGP